MKINIQGCTVSYETIGKGHPVFMLHGYGNDRAIMKGFMEPALSKYGTVKRFYLDLPGMGKSTVSSKITCSNDMLAVIIEFIERVIQEPVLIAGLSYGGYLARGIAHYNPKMVNGMFLVCPMVYPYERRREQHTVCEKDEEFLSTLPDDLREDFSSFAVIQTAEVFKRYAQEILPGDHGGDRDFLRSAFRIENYGFSFDPDEYASSYLKPVTFIAGKHDKAVGYKDALDVSINYPRSTIAVLDGTGHLAQIERPEVIIALAHDWLLRCGITQHE